MDYRAAAASKMPSSLEISRPQYYNTDGSGRDTYIKVNNGGLTSQYSPVKGPPVGKKSHYHLIPKTHSHQFTRVI